MMKMTVDERHYFYLTDNYKSNIPGQTIRLVDLVGNDRIRHRIVSESEFFLHKLGRIPFDRVPEWDTSERIRSNPTEYAFRIIQDPLGSCRRKSTEKNRFSKITIGSRRIRPSRNTCVWGQSCKRPAHNRNLTRWIVIVTEQAWAS